MAQALTLLPQTLSPANRRSVDLFISDVRESIETGKVHTVYRYCPETYCSDGYTPPNLDFRNCFLHSNTTALTPGGPSLKKLISKKSHTKLQKQIPDVINGVILHRRNLQHVFSTHCVVASDINFSTCRKKSIFQVQQPITKLPGNSVFLSVGMVTALITLTIQFSDKITVTKLNCLALEKAFRTEIGHNTQGCCHIVRVIVSRCCSETTRGATFDLKTAFPVSTFLPTFSN